MSSTKPSNGPLAESSRLGHGDKKGRSTFMAGPSFSGTRKGRRAMLIHVKPEICATWKPAMDTRPDRSVERPSVAPSAKGRFE